MDHLHLRPADLPADLRNERRFLVWRLVGRHKVPLDRRGRRCNADDPAHWRSLSDAAQQVRYAIDGPGGVGYALKGSGRVALDWDDCVDEQTGRLTDEAERMIALFGSYAELSQSGCGARSLIEGALPGDRNRDLPGVELKAIGHITMTGHTLVPAPIAPGGEAWARFLAAIGPRPTDLTAAAVEPLPVASPEAMRAVLRRAMRHAQFARLYTEGDWSEFLSRSEADFMLCLHAGRNGADRATCVALMKASNLPRDPRRNAAYFNRTALAALGAAVPKVGLWTGVTLPAKDVSEQRAVERLQGACTNERDAVLLHRLAQEVTRQRARRQEREGGWFRVSPQNISGDFDARPDFAVPQKVMSRRGCLKALKRLSGAGLFELRTVEDVIVWHPGDTRRERRGIVTEIRCAGADTAAILHGFADRLAGSAVSLGEDHDPLCKLLGTRVPSIVHRRTVRPVRSNDADAA